MNQQDGKNDSDTEGSMPESRRKLKDVYRETMAASYESDILKSLFVSTFVPLILLEISTVGSGFIDGLVVSQFLGTKDLASQGLASPYFAIAGIVGGLLVTGMQTLATKAYGAGDVKQAEGFYSMALTVGGAASLALAFIFFFASGPIGEVFGANGDSADLLPSLELYLKGLAIGTPAIVLFSLLIPIVQMNGGGKVVRISVILGVIANAVLDILAGVLGWGMLGMGLATSIATWAEYVILLVYSLSSKSSVRFSRKDADWSKFGTMVAMGLPKAIRKAANIFRPLLLNNLVLIIGGSTAMSAWATRNSMDSIGDVVGSGIAAAVMLLVGVLYGEENRDGIMQVCRLSVKWISLAVGAVALAMFILAPWLADLYATGNTEVAELSTFAIRCVAVNIVLNALIEAYVNFLQATEQMFRTYVITIAIRFVLIVAVSYLMGYLFGIYGVWLSSIVSSLIVIGAVVVIAMVRKRSIKIGPDDILGLRTDFGATPENTLWYNITSDNPKYTTETEDIYELCERCGLEKQKAFRVALCLEEMVTNIIDYGFSSDGKPHSIDIRIVAKNDDLILRIRDDCELFNVREKGEAWMENPEDITKNLGIRLTMASARDLKYVNTLGTNTLLITV